MSKRPLLRFFIKTVTWVTVFVTAFLVISVAVYAPKVLNFKPVKPLPKADSVVSLAPLDQRLPEAVTLLNEESIEPLVVSTPKKPFFGQDLTQELLVQTVCDESVANIYCFAPKPETTIGEALGVRELAQENGWQTVIVVTNDYHAARTDFIFTACLPETEVAVHSFSQGMNPIKWVYRLVYESVAFVKAQLEVELRCA